MFVVSDDPPVCNLSMYFSCALPTISESALNKFSLLIISSVRAETILFSALANCNFILRDFADEFSSSRDDSISGVVRIW